jgi:hypothetical protein
MHSDSACPELLARIRQLEEETARLQLLIAELVLKNQHLRRDIHAAGVCACNWTERQDIHAGRKLRCLDGVVPSAAKAAFIPK